MADVVSFVNDLDTLLNDGTDGVNANLDGSAPEQLENIRSTFDQTDGFFGESPALLAMHEGATPSAGSQNLRKWDHSVAFYYRYTNPDPAERRKNAAYTLHALLKSVSPKDGLPTSISGIRQVTPQGVTTDLWGREEDMKDVLLMARIEFQTKETL